MLLALDTATTTASLALYDLAADCLLGEWTWQARRRQTQDLLSAASTLLAQLDRKPADLTALAVTTGPGSFTGVRIGISTVKGLGLGLPAMPKVVGIPTLRVTAEPWLATAAAGNEPAAVCAAIQAGRGRYNWIIFAPGEQNLRPGVRDHVAGAASDFMAALSHEACQPLWLVGEIDAELADAVRNLPHVTLIDHAGGWRRAGHLASLAAQAIAAGDDEELAALQPLYLRKAG